MIADTAKATLPSLAKRYTEEQVFDVIRKYYGNKSLVIAALQCTSQQFNVWLRKPGRKEVLAEARERILDKCEEKMMALLDSEDARVVLETSKFILQHLGRARGWSGDSPAMQVCIQKSSDDLRVQVQALFGIQDNHN